MTPISTQGGRKGGTHAPENTCQGRGAPLGTKTAGLPHLPQSGLILNSTSKNLHSKAGLIKCSEYVWAIN